MEAVIEFVTINPLYGLGIVAGVLFLLFALVKKMVKVAVVVVILNIAYGYALQNMAQEAYTRAQTQYELAKDKAENLIDDADSLINP